MSLCFSQSAVGLQKDRVLEGFPVSFVLLCNAISPAELNSLSTAALASIGALSFANKFFSVLAKQ